MQSETSFTATSGHRCQYEVLIEENGRANVNVVWLGGKPSDQDQEELARFIKAQADQAGFRYRGIETVHFGQIERKDVPRAGEIFRERIDALKKK